jgi:hypothetical protein
VYFERAEDARHDGAEQAVRDDPPGVEGQVMQNGPGVKGRRRTLRACRGCAPVAQGPRDDERPAHAETVETACQPNDKRSKYFKHIGQDYSRSGGKV